MMRRAFLAAALVCTGLASPAIGQIASTPAQSIGIAKVELLETCPEFSGRDLTLVGDKSTTAGVFAPILGGLLGDVAGAGLNALASALETASQERAFGAEGRTNFEFYKLDTDDMALAVPRLGDDLTCMVLEVPGAHINYAEGIANWPPTDFLVNGRSVTRLDGSRLDQKEVDELKSRFSIKPPALLKLEAQIVRMQDAFYIRPVYVHYIAKLDGAPSSKALPSELHVKLATPAAASGGIVADTVFAIARVPLPKLKPGDIWWAEQITTQSALMPFRANEGTTAALKLVLAGATARSKAEEDLAAAQVQMAHAIGVRLDGSTVKGCVAVKCPAYIAQGSLDGYDLSQLLDWARGPGSKVPADRLAALAAAESIYAAAILTIDQSTGRLAAAIGPSGGTPLAGSTTLEARVVMTRSANKFGLAIASALKKQEAPLSTAVSGLITNDDPAWTQAKSDLAIARLTVTHKEQALARAKAGGEADAIETAELALLQAKLDANLRSSALDLPISYPELAK